MSRMEGSREEKIEAMIEKIEAHPNLRSFGLEKLAEAGFWVDGVGMAVDIAEADVPYVVLALYTMYVRNGREEERRLAAAPRRREAIAATKAKG
jgi:hypothetical protein